jgi:hypothetical protein
LSFRALDIEQIGHVYEGLLDHMAKRASEPILGLAGSKGKESDIPLATLEEIARKGTAALVEFLRDATGRSEKALTQLIEEPPASDEHALLVACGQDKHLARRVKPFEPLLRLDSFGQLVVVPPGSVYVTSGSDRRSTGTHYTPRLLTEPIVKHTLEPLVYVGPAEGLLESEWTLRTPKEILALKVCDMAMGSGAFLVESCRYLGERLVEAWETAEHEHPGSFVVSPDGELSSGAPTERLIPVDSAERVAIARRYVADRCLYGVDINPMAVEMAKLSLWLTTLQRDRAFTFLDHALKCGDSLLGVSSIDQIELFSLRPGIRQITFATAGMTRYVEEASAKRLALEALPSDDHTQIESKGRLHAEAEAATAQIKALADCVLAFELRGLDGAAYEAERTAAAGLVEVAMRKALPDFQAYACECLGGWRRFHWSVEFPEVFALGGFDAFVGNPPFLGGKRISTEHGAQYERYLKTAFDRSKGAADLCCYFFRRAFRLVKPASSYLGLLATSSITEGDSRDVALGAILDQGGKIYRARSAFPWPGQAGVFAAAVHMTHAGSALVPVLDEQPVDTITSYLDSRQTKTPYPLLSNGISYTQGQTLNGDGFIIDTDERERLVAADASNRDVIKPYLNGSLFNEMADLTPKRWAIDFGTREENEAACYVAPFELVTKSVKPHRDRLSKQVHESRYWLYWDKRERFLASVSHKERILVCPIVSKYVSFRFVPPAWVFSHRLKLFDVQTFDLFALLQSSIHEVWARQFSSTLGQTMNYSTSDAFDTFPFICDGERELSRVGETYDETREATLRARNIGITELYNHFNDPGEKAGDIERLRALHWEMDRAVAIAYGWRDLDLGHGFHETKRGMRYTLAQAAHHTVLDRLLALNLLRHAEEENAGLNRKGARSRKNKGARSAVSLQPDLLD